MAGNKSLETRKNKVSEIGKNIEKKSERLSELQEAKEAAREWRMQIENNENLDEEERKQASEVSNERYEAISKEASEVSSEVGEDLKELEDLGIIQRTSYESNTLHVEYCLTHLGHTLQPIFQELIMWGLNYSQERRNPTQP